MTRLPESWRDQLAEAAKHRRDQRITSAEREFNEALRAIEVVDSLASAADLPAEPTAPREATADDMLGVIQQAINSGEEFTYGDLVEALAGKGIRAPGQRLGGTLMGTLRAGRIIRTNPKDDAVGRYRAAPSAKGGKH